MNDIIRQLAEQTYLVKLIDEHHREFGHGEVDYSDIEKFVELVVTECMRVINGDIYFQANKGILTNVGGLNQARCLISHHFEVELTQESVPLRD